MVARTVPAARRGAAAALLVALAAVHLWLAAGAGPGGFLSDDSLYLLMAEWYAGEREAVVEQVATYSHLPRLYPLLLAMVGARGDAPLPGHLLNAALFGAALILAFAWHRRRQPAAAALAGVCLVAIAPASLLQSLTLWSEPLYTALSLAALLALPGDRGGAPRWLAVVLLAGLALAARSAGLALLAALAWAVWRQRPPRPWLLLAVALAPSLLLGFLGPASRPEEDYLDLIGGVLLGTGPAPLHAVLADNLQALGDGWVRSFDLLGLGSLQALALLALLPVLAGWLARLRRGAVDAVYVAFYLAMILPWPATPDVLGRLLLPLLPLAAGYAADAGLAAARALPRGGGRLGTPLVAALPQAALAVVMLPSLLLIASRLAAPLPEPLEPLRLSPWWLRDPDTRHALTVLDDRASTWHAARALRAQVPADACLLARPVQFYMLHARRETWLPRVLAEGNPPGCRYFYVDAGERGVILLDGVPGGSRVSFVPQTLMPPRRAAGMLLELPQEASGR